MPLKEFVVEFFRVTMPAGHTLEGVLSNACAIPLRNRTLTLGTTPIRVEEFAVNGQYAEGDMVRVQMENLPLKASVDTRCAPLDLSVDDGIGHQIAFLYYPPWRVLLLQRSRSGVSPSMFARYIEVSIGGDAVVQLEPIARQDAMARLEAVDDFKKVKIRVAGADRIQPYDTGNHSTNAVVNLLTSVEAPQIDIEIKASRGRNHRAPKRERVLAMVRSLLQLPNNVADVEAINIEGRTADGYMEKLRMFDFFLIAKATAPIIDRMVSYEGRARALRTAWKSKTDELNAMFGAVI